MAAFLFTSLPNVFRPSFSRLSRLIHSNSVSLSTSKPTLNSVPDPPKRPLSAYLAFYINKRSEFARLNPDLKSRKLVSEIGTAWNSLSPQLKKQYEDESVKQFSNFKNLYLKWWNDLSVEQKQEFLKSKEREKKKKGDRRLKRKLRELGMPRKPLSAFNFFMSNSLQFSKDAPKEHFGKVAHSWKNMTDVEKKPYFDMEIKDLERHTNEMIAWEKRMEKEGYSDLIQTDSKENSASTKRRSSPVSSVKKPFNSSKTAK